MFTFGFIHVHSHNVSMDLSNEEHETGSNTKDSTISYHYVPSRSKTELLIRNSLYCIRSKSPFGSTFSVSNMKRKYIR